MVRYPKTQSDERPLEIEVTELCVFLASDIEEIEIDHGEDFGKQKGYEFTYDVYTKDEYLVKQNNDINLIAQSLGINLNDTI